MNCKNCGALNPEESRFCTACGCELAAPAEAVQAEPQVVEQAPVYQAPVSPQPQQPQIPEEYKPVSPWGYFGLSLLFSIPIAGFIMLIVFSFKRGNINRRNYARSYWCALLIGAIVFVVYLIVLLILMGATGAAISEFM